MQITDPGDSVMVVAPYYGNFDADVCLNTGVDIVPVYLNEKDDFEVKLHHQNILEEALQQAAMNGKTIKALLFTNPHNPLGRCFSRQDIETMLRFCSKHTLHFISDEVYGLSTFGHLLSSAQEAQDPFISVLSIPNLESLIEPKLVHVIYGLSKDFCMNGLRVGFIIDQFNEELRSGLSATALLSYMSTLNDRVLCNMLADEEWVDSFIAMNRRRLADSYLRTTELLRYHDIGFHSAEGSHFLLIDARSILEKRNKGRRPVTVEDEKDIWRAMMANGVYISPGHIFHTREPGYFRFIFAQSWDKLEDGINKLAALLLDRPLEKEQEKVK